MIYDTVVSLNTPQDPLTELIRQGARDLIAQAVDAELQPLLAQYQNYQSSRFPAVSGELAG